MNCVIEQQITHGNETKYMTELKITRLGNIKDTKDLLILTNSLEKVRVKGKESWTPIDIITPIAQGTAGFIIGRNNIDCLTFYTKVDQYTNESIMWIWTASADGVNPFEVYLEDIKILAKHINCTSVHWSSKRKGYLRRLPKIGGDVYQIEYKIII